jgi:hypothetical protein
MSRWFKLMLVLLGAGVFFFLFLKTPLEHSTRLARQEASIVRHLRDILSRKAVRFDEFKAGAQPLAIVASDRHPVEDYYVLEYRINNDERTYTITAIPRDWSKNFRSFFIDSASGEIRFESGKVATAESKALE